MNDPALRTETPETIVKIWRNGIIPVIFCCASPPELRVKLPFATGNRAWIQPATTQVRWDKHRKCWIVAKRRFSSLVRDCLHRHGKAYVIQQRKELEKCAPACWNATGMDCECSCGGTNHGCGDEDRWHIVHDAFAFRWHSVGYSCRLIESKQSDYFSVTRLENSA